MTEAIIHIDSLAFGGAGFGRLDGKACFVPFTAPGDVARIKITHEKTSYVEGEVLTLQEESPQRVASPCPVFGVCGGCTWQHLSYSAQLEAKKQIFTETLRRFGRVDPARIDSPVPAEHPYGYRSRAQFKVRWVGGKLHMGFYRRGSHFVVDIPVGCALCHPMLNEALAEIRHLLICFAESDRIPQVDAAVGEDGAVLIIVHYIGDSPGKARNFFEDAQNELTSVNGLHLQFGRKDTIERVWGIDELSYCFPAGFLPDLPEISLVFSRGGFSQVNYQQNRELVRAVHRMACLTGSERLLDLFCGNGNFSLPLARYAAAVAGVEEYGPSLDDGRRNARDNGTSAIDFILSDAAAGVRFLVSRGDSFPVVVLDPPRTGAKEAVREIVRLNPERIVYVSCDPATLGRDLGLFGKDGYAVCESLPVDMFPQTYHIESVTLLRKA
ncbi:MAG: 23S rRNA (uracil(1939)-C(5))-methyltransferase RlmD [Desulfuromonadales bacterium]|nr:MAG: 23S rRNA (uracil(1939)-C(5))-methyltransferase RlmD [Desulfuromonadales bacterium]